MDFKEIGDLLRVRREELQLTLENVHQVTKIRLHFLRAIEDGDDSLMPATVYAQGFIRSYASYVGLDGEELAAAYRRYREAQGDTGPSMAKVSEAAGRRARPLVERPVRWQSTPGPSASGRTEGSGLAGRGLGSMLLGILVISALIFGTVYAIKSVRGDLEGWAVSWPWQRDVARGPADPGAPDSVGEGDGQDEPDGQDDDPAAGPDAPPTEPEPPPGPPAVDVVAEPGAREIVYLVQGDGPLELSVEAADRSWAEVWVDEEKVLAGFFEAGEVYEYTGQGLIRVWAGNPPVLSVTVNGRPMGNPAGGAPRDLIVRRPPDEVMEEAPAEAEGEQ